MIFTTNTLEERVIQLEKIVEALQHLLDHSHDGIEKCFEKIEALEKKMENNNDR